MNILSPVSLRVLLSLGAFAKQNVWNVCIWIRECMRVIAICWRLLCFFLSLHSYAVFRFLSTLCCRHPISLWLFFFEFFHSELFSASSLSYRFCSSFLCASTKVYGRVFLLLLKWKLSTMICKVGLFILFLFRCLFFLLPFLLFLRRLFFLVFLSRARSMNVFVCLFRESNHNSICLSHTHKHFINVYNCLWLCDSSANVCLRMCG